MQTSPPTDKLNVDGSLAVWGVLFIAFFASVELAVWALGGSPTNFLIPALVMSFIVLVVSYNIFRQGRFRRYSYAWYRETFPDMVRGDGKVRCRHCGGQHITVRNLMQRTFYRAHLCNQCGETLYFSPER